MPKEVPNNGAYVGNVISYSAQTLDCNVKGKYWSYSRIITRYSEYIEAVR